MNKTLKRHTVQTQITSNWFPSTTCLSRILSWFVFTHTHTIHLYYGFKKRVECTLGALVFQNKHHLFTTGGIFLRCQQKLRWGFVCLCPLSLSPVKTRWPFNKMVILSYCCTKCVPVCVCVLWSVCHMVVQLCTDMIIKAWPDVPASCLWYGDFICSCEW